MRNSLHALKLCAWDGVEILVDAPRCGCPRPLSPATSPYWPEQVSSPLEDQPTCHHGWRPAQGPRGGRINTSRNSSPLLRPTDFSTTSLQVALRPSHLRDKTLERACATDTDRRWDGRRGLAPGNERGGGTVRHARAVVISGRSSALSRQEHHRHRIPLRAVVGASGRRRRDVDSAGRTRSTANATAIR